MQATRIKAVHGVQIIPGPKTLTHSILVMSITINQIRQEVLVILIEHRHSERLQMDHMGDNGVVLGYLAQIQQHTDKLSATQGRH